jgi:hypothetical protein
VCFADPCHTCALEPTAGTFETLRVCAISIYTQYKIDARSLVIPGTMFSLFGAGKFIGVFSSVEKACEYALTTSFLEDELEIHTAQLDSVYKSPSIGKFIWGKNALSRNGVMVWISNEYRYMEEVISDKMHEIKMIRQEIHINLVALEALYNLDANNTKAPVVIPMRICDIDVKSLSGNRKPLSEFMDSLEKDLLTCRYINGQLKDDISRLKDMTGFQGHVNELIIINPDLTLTPTISFNN